jgi:hypothetical protein
MTSGAVNSSLSTSSATILIDSSTLAIKGTGSTPTGASVTNSSNFTLRIGGSKLVGPVVNSGTLTCVGSYNGDYVALGSNCQ